jgi:hypothetical protein
MATKKKKVTKKKVAKKTAKKTAAKKERAPRKRSERKKLPPYVPNPERIERFMHTMIQSGYMGKEIADNGKERKRQAGSVRQMAEVCDRQLRKADDAAS